MARKSPDVGSGAGECPGFGLSGEIRADFVPRASGVPPTGELDPLGRGAGQVGGRPEPGADKEPGEQGCDPLDPAVCLQPWPNDLFTVADSTTDTGKRLNLNLLGMPRNIAGVGSRRRP